MVGRLSAVLALVAAWAAMASEVEVADDGGLAPWGARHSKVYEAEVRSSLLERAPSEAEGQLLYNAWMDRRITEQAARAADARDAGIRELGESTEEDASVFDLAPNEEGSEGEIDKEAEADKNTAQLPELKKKAGEMAARILNLEKTRSTLASQNTMTPSTVPSGFNAPKEIETARNTKIMRSISTADTSGSHSAEALIETERDGIEKMLLQRYNGTNKASVIAKVAKVFKSFVWNTEKSQEEKDAEAAEQKAIADKAAADTAAKAKAQMDLDAATAATKHADALQANKTAAALANKTATAALAATQAAVDEKLRMDNITKSPEVKAATASAVEAAQVITIPFEKIADQGSHAGKAQITAAVEAVKTKILDLQKKAMAEKAFAKVNPEGEKAGKVAAKKVLADKQTAKDELIKQEALKEHTKAVASKKAEKDQLDAKVNKLVGDKVTKEKESQAKMMAKVMALTKQMQAGGAVQGGVPPAANPKMTQDQAKAMAAKMGIKTATANQTAQAMTKDQEKAKIAEMVANAKAQGAVATADKKGSVRM